MGDEKERTCGRFIWDPEREIDNIYKHGIDFVTYRGGKIRIFGAGYWRKGERYYEKEND